MVYGNRTGQFAACQREPLPTRDGCLNGGMSTSGPRLVSIGYEGRHAEEMIAYLVAEQVSVLIDVRLTPLSRKPGMSKRRLASALQAAGIDYVHLKQLGNPKDNRDGFRAGEHTAHERFRGKLAGEEEVRAIRHVSELLENDVVALLCFEHDHVRCHRALVADALAETQPSLAISQL